MRRILQVGICYSLRMKRMLSHLLEQKASNKDGMFPFRFTYVLMPTVGLLWTIFVISKELEDNIEIGPTPSLFPTCGYFAAGLVPNKNDGFSVLVSPSRMPCVPLLEVVKVVHQLIHWVIIIHFILVVHGPFDGTVLTGCFIHDLCNTSAIETFAFTPPCSKQKEKRARE